MSNDKWKMNLHLRRPNSSLPASDVTRTEFRGWRCGRAGKRHVLHSQIRQERLDHFRLLRTEIAVRLLFQHSEDVDPVLRSFEIDAGFAGDRMRHHPQTRGRV